MGTEYYTRDREGNGLRVAPALLCFRGLLLCLGVRCRAFRDIEREGVALSCDIRETFIDRGEKKTSLNFFLKNG